MTEKEASLPYSKQLQGQPRGYFLVVPPQSDSGEIDYAEFFSVLMKSWKVLAIALLIGAGLAACIAARMPNMYRAELLAVPVTSNGFGSEGNLRGQFGGLAALAGINLNAAGNRKNESFATLTSAGFARDFIVAENLMPVLFASRWDASTKNWRAGKKAPTLEEGVKKFTTQVLSAEESRKTGLVTVKVEWTAPELAANWANHLVERVNDRLRDEAIRGTDQSIGYLQKELAKTNVVELRQAIYNLIEFQVNNAMQANVQREYAFRVIDAAVAPEKKISPRRAIIVLVGAGLGLLIGFSVIFLRRIGQRSRT